MALVRVGFTVAGEKQISRGFYTYSLAITSLEEPLDRMADELLAAVRLQFATEGVAGLGAKWTPLEASYRAWKEKHWPGRPILVRTGGMKGALLNKKHAVTITPTTLVYEPKGEGGRRASFHQTGHHGEHGTLPQRKIVALTTAQKREMVDRNFAVWLHEQMVKAGLQGPGSGAAG